MAYPPHSPQTRGRAPLWKWISWLALVSLFTVSVSVFLARVWRNSEPQPAELQEVVVARNKINIRTPIARRHFKVVKLPQDLIPEGSYQSLDELFPPKINLPKRTLKRVLYPREVLIKDRISDPSRGGGLQSLIAKNQLAFSFEVGSLTTRSHVIYPSARIDVLATFKRPEERDSITKLIAQNLRVLSVNQISDVSEFEEYLRERKLSSRADVLTVLAKDLEQARTLTHASSVGKLSILLRNTRDFSVIEPPGVSTDQLSLRDGEVDDSKRRKANAKRSNRFRRVTRPRSSQSERRSPRAPQRSPQNVTTIQL